MNEHLPLFHVIDVRDNSVKLETSKFKECADFMGLKIDSAYKALYNGSTSKLGYKVIRAREGYKKPRNRSKKDVIRLYSVYDNKRNGIIVFQGYSMRKCAQYLGMSEMACRMAYLRKSVTRKGFTIDSIEVPAPYKYDEL